MSRKNRRTGGADFTGQVSSGDFERELEAKLDVWRFQIGRLVLAMGEVEYCLRRCLVEIPEVDRWHELKDEDFKVKATAAIRHVQASGFKAALKKRLVTVINKAIRLAPVRNLVSHSPVHLSEYRSGDGKRHMIRFEAFSLRNSDKTMTLRELTAIAKEAIRIAADFHRLWFYEVQQIMRRAT